MIRPNATINTNTTNTKDVEPLQQEHYKYKPLIPLEQEDTKESPSNTDSAQWNSSCAAVAGVLLLFATAPIVGVWFSLSACLGLVVACIYESKMKATFQPTRVKACAFHSQRPWLLLANYAGEIELWNTSNTATVNRIIKFGASAFPVRACQFLEHQDCQDEEDAVTIVTAGDDSMVSVFRLSQEGSKVEKVSEFQAHSDYIRSLAVHPTQPLVLSSADDMTIKLWDTKNVNSSHQNWTCVRIFEGHCHYVVMVKIDPRDTNTFATASLDCTIQFWNLNQDQPRFALEGHQKGVNCIEFCSSSDLSLLASGSDDQTVLIWDYSSRQLLYSLQGHQHHVCALLFHPSLPILFSTSEDGTVRYWTIPDNDVLCSNQQKQLYTDENLFQLELEPHGKGRGWTLAGSFQKLAIGFDEGCIMTELVQMNDRKLKVVGEEFLSR